LFKWNLQQSAYKQIFIWYSFFLNGLKQENVLLYCFPAFL
jgi:hypothetical protein